MPSYYEILGLPEPLHNAPVIPVQALRGAKKRALLKNHPDKSTNPALKSKENTYSIDQISEAFSTLSHPTSRATYDKELKLQNTATNSGGAKGQEVFRTGVETVDLDDLEVDEIHGVWYRSCRCGDNRGFLICELDLEEAAEEGELSVGCRGCSLWLKVLFGVVVEQTQFEPDKREGESDHEAT